MHCIVRIICSTLNCATHRHTHTPIEFIHHGIRNWISCGLLKKLQFIQRQDLLQKHCSQMLKVRRFVRFVWLLQQGYWHMIHTLTYIYLSRKLSASFYAKSIFVLACENELSSLTKVVITSAFHYEHFSWTVNFCVALKFLHIVQIIYCKEIWNSISRKYLSKLRLNNGRSKCPLIWNRPFCFGVCNCIHLNCTVWQFIKKIYRKLWLKFSNFNIKPYFDGFVREFIGHGQLSRHFECIGLPVFQLDIE